jgi:receptor protein-tyrosine kinase
LSIIEQAARRLEQLRRSGIDVPGGDRSADRGGVVRERSRVAVLPPAPAKADPRVFKPAARVEPVEVEPPQRSVHAPVVEPSKRQSREVSLNLAKLGQQGFLTPDSPRSQLADEFRVIKRPLLNNATGKSAGPIERANLVMVTSSLPGEGKTFTAINLALSLATELDTTVLLVDADVARPSVLSRLGLPSSRGLLDVLTDAELDLADVLLRTNIEKLSILPAGTPSIRATELLASDAMNSLLEELASRYADRILIFDAPPLLPSTESRVLATHMGQVVLVVEAERTSQHSVSQALATLESCPVVMTLLNKVPRSEVGSYYGYYGPAAE